MKKVLIDIEGRPKGKARPRFHGYTAYTPAGTREYEGKVRGEYLRKYGNKIMYQNAPVMVTVLACYPIPKNASRDTRKQMMNGELIPMVTPDIDNVIKVILDGLNGLAYKDDKQVVAVVGRKQYDVTGHVIVKVENVPR